MKKQFKFTAWCTITLEAEPGAKKSSFVSSDFNLLPGENINKDAYLNKKGLVATPAGVQAVTQCFVQGLIANIHMAHQKELRNDAEHLRYIISELEKGLIRLSEITEENI